MGARKTDDVLDKLYPFIVDIQESLDRYLLYMITISLLKISIGDKTVINNVLDKWMHDFFEANVETIQTRLAEVFGTAAVDDPAPLHLIALQSVTNIVKKTLIQLLEAIENNMGETTKPEAKPVVSH